MEKLSREEWLDAIHDVAVDAANNYVKFVEQFQTPADGLDEKVIGDVETFLQKKYPYEQVSNEDIDVLKKFTPESIWKWEVHGKEDGDEYDPRAKHEAEELAKYMPFLRGVAPEGKSWMDGRQDLKLKGSELGFDYNQEGMSKFLNKLAKYQTVFDRAQLMKEMREQRLGIPFTDIEFGPKGSAYVLGSLASPSATHSIENAVSTGEDLSPWQAGGLAATDVGANSLMFYSPGTSARFLKSSPIIAGALDATMQGGIELGRQYGQTAIDPTLEADPKQAIIASTLGLSRPALVGSAQGLVSKIPGKTAMDFSRGIGKATRAGNPVATEKETIREMVKNHNNLIKKNLSDTEDYINTSVEMLRSQGKPITKEVLEGIKKEAAESEAYLMNKSVADTEKMFGTKKVNEMADFLGIKPDANGVYDIEKFMAAYDKKPVYTWLRKDGKVETVKRPWKSSDVLFQLNPDNATQYKALFPAKYADEAGASKIRAAGLKAGELLGNIGGRFEPTFKINPVEVVKGKLPDYKEQDWYLRLGPKSRAIIDEAFKKKMEEDAGAYYLDVE